MPEVTPETHVLLGYDHITEKKMYVLRETYDALYANINKDKTEGKRKDKELETKA